MKHENRIALLHSALLQSGRRGAGRRQEATLQAARYRALLRGVHCPGRPGPAAQAAGHVTTLPPRPTLQQQSEARRIFFYKTKIRLSHTVIPDLIRDLAFICRKAEQW